MEEVKLWLGRLADKSVDGYKQIGDVLFYKSHVPAVVQAGQSAVEVSHAGIKDFVSAYNLSLFNPILLAGLFIGAMMCFVFVAMAMKAVGRNAGRMVDEVRRQFREIPGIMEGTGRPEYAKCVAIATKGAQKEMVVPALMAIISTCCYRDRFWCSRSCWVVNGRNDYRFTLASMLNNAGGAWDNAKKYIERGNYGGKKSECHKASIVGDTVGDPFKDTCGPSMNILIKLMSMVAVVMAGVTVAWSLF